MVSEAANVQLIKQLYEAMGKGDVDGALALMTDDITFVVPGPAQVGAAGVWQGPDGVRECLRLLREAQTNQHVEMREFIAQRDRVVVVLHVVATVLSTGKTFESDIVHLFTIRDGKVARLLDFFDTAALVEAHRG